jgi:hypothetical protein
MTRSPLFDFILGSVFGGMIAMTVTLHIATNQVQARNATINEGLQRATEHIQEAQRAAIKTIDAWKSRAELCEVKERYVTVLYEYRPSTSLPVLHGAFAITLGSAGNHPDSDMKPVWVIPAQVPVYTNFPGASYEWVDAKTGASIGRFPAVPPPSVPQ